MRDRIDLLVDGPENAEGILVLAHGAGAPMDSPFMNELAPAGDRRQIHGRPPRS